MSELPGRSQSEEDDFVARWSADDNSEGLIAAITAAIEGRRPSLAARLVNLLDDDVAVEPDGPVARAKRAARFLLHEPPDVRELYFNAMEEAWHELHKARMKRIKSRMRARGAGKSGRESTTGRDRNGRKR